ncbi:MAG: hypothetical protein COW01_06090 [Bdellovibrionales bacterium CG12_big_fil_rev_8_21_14_0_65_38_15]|nr:MAG: hypothetical protein COW79_03985 [Bdellovibrionales bacterium CG22_combo_CG10-13_8_21_14_all_38_13]PIQ56001.1 MAG: hypothetical protein COW01_06090 [Bdellovibrionales bacterium CG12_big_fil_rev_8_21_14_0_65_38_15]PIR30606.1 MAG: hypothetical protein COV38_04630 [Bdellovibrionales bacterium CG11_big_fil_rev_8_21_14_0_20_38_13]
MFDQELYKILSVIGMVFPLSLSLQISAKLKKLIFLLSTVLLVVGAGLSMPWTLSIILISSYLCLIGKEDFYNGYIFLLIICIGNWSNPGITELLLVLLTVIINLKFSDRVSKFVIPVFAITTMLYIVNSSAITTSSVVAFCLMISISLLFFSVFTKNIEIKDSFSVLSLFLISSQLKIIIEQNSSNLSLSMYNTWFSFNILMVFIVLMKILAFYEKSENIKQEFLKLSAISFFLPSFVSLAPISTNEIAMYAMVNLIGSILYLHQKNYTKFDTMLLMAVGSIIIGVQIYVFIGLDLQGPALFVTVMLLASELFYLIKSIENREDHSVSILYRERLPQLVFISIAFGWICTLWYILYYVRKIQG